MYHILIVDEEEHLVWALERNLFPDRNDIIVHTAMNGEQGLEILRAQTMDMLICDIKMSGPVDGFQLILRAKEIAPDARVMVITAFGAERIEKFAERIGITHYLEKPFNVGDLREAILEVLDEKEGFQGVLSDLELTDIIQMLCLAKRTALLHLKHRDERGKIVFERGELVHAEFGEIIGADAVYRMLALRQGDIFMQSDFENEHRTITSGWQDVLLEGVKRADEHHFDENETSQAAQEPIPRKSERTPTPFGIGGAMGLDVLADPPSRPLGEEASDGMMLFSADELEEMAMAGEAAMIEETGHTEVSDPLDGDVFAAPALNGRQNFDSEGSLVVAEDALERFAGECPGFCITGLISTSDEGGHSFMQGSSMVRFYREGVSASLLEVIAGAHRTVKALHKSDSIEEMQISLGEHYVLLRVVEGTSYWHLAVVDRQANLGIALVLMRQLGRQFQVQESVPA